MKKILGVLFVLFLGLIFVGSASAASSDCLNIKFDNGDSVCLDIAKTGTKKFKISIDKSNITSPSYLTCRITLPNSYIYFLNGCNGTFTYEGTATRQILLSVSYTDKYDDSFYKWISTDVNFRNGYRGFNTRTLNSGESSRNSRPSNRSGRSASSRSSSTNDEIGLSTNRKSPSVNQFVNLTIETDDDYVGKLSFSAKYRDSSSSSWTSISNLTSYTYFSDYSDEWDDGYYKMKSSDYGQVTLKNLVKFRKSGYYRIYVKDTSGNESYIQFSVGDVDDESINKRNNELKITVSPSSIDINEWIKATIKTDNDYTNKVSFSKFQYKSNYSSSWSNISRTSTTYVSDYSNEWDDGYYRMKSSDYGQVTLKNLVKFRKSGYYRIYIEDIYGKESYVQISVDVSDSSSSNTNDEIGLSTNRKSPSVNQFVNLTIETDDDYVGKLSFSAKYRDSSSSSWTSISNLTSYTYFSDYSDEWDDGYYKMKSSDYGQVTLKNLVKFRKSGYYRIYVKDTSGNESYIQFSVGDVDDESSVSGFSSSELNTVKSVYNKWEDLIDQLKKKYSSLRKDYYWRTMSENLYEDMEDIIYNKKPRDLNNYYEFKEAFDDWYDYTMDNI